MSAGRWLHVAGAILLNASSRVTFPEGGLTSKTASFSCSLREYKCSLIVGKLFKWWAIVEVNHSEENHTE